MIGLLGGLQWGHATHANVARRGLSHGQQQQDHQPTVGQRITTLMLSGVSTCVVDTGQRQVTMATNEFALFDKVTGQLSDLSALSRDVAEK